MQARLVFTSCARCPLLLSEALTCTLQREKIHLTVCAAAATPFDGKAFRPFLQIDSLP